MAHDRTCSPIFGPDVNESASGPAVRMVVNNDIKVNFLKTFVVAWLRVEDGKARKFVYFYPGDRKEAHPEQSDHGQIVRSSDLVDMGDNSRRHLPPQNAL